MFALECSVWGGLFFWWVSTTGYSYLNSWHISKGSYSVININYLFSFHFLLPWNTNTFATGYALAVLGRFVQYICADTPLDRSPRGSYNVTSRAYAAINFQNISIEMKAVKRKVLCCLRDDWMNCKQPLDSPVSNHKNGRKLNVSSGPCL